MNIYKNKSLGCDTQKVWIPLLTLDTLQLMVNYWTLVWLKWRILLVKWDDAQRVVQVNIIHRKIHRKKMKLANVKIIMEKCLKMLTEKCFCSPNKTQIEIKSKQPGLNWDVKNPRLQWQKLRIRTNSVAYLIISGSCWCTLLQSCIYYTLSRCLKNYKLQLPNLWHLLDQNTVVLDNQIL